VPGRLQPNTDLGYPLQKRRDVGHVVVQPDRVAEREAGFAQDPLQVVERAVELGFQIAGM